MEMNHSLQQGFESLKLIDKKNNSSHENDILGNLGSNVQYSETKIKPSEVSCEICSEEFKSKKELRNHILTHLREPRVVLKRLSNQKIFKTDQINTYWLDTKKGGDLKLTLKKQKSPNLLKLKLKKSSSKDFTVVNNSSLNTAIQDEENLAGAENNNGTNYKAQESSTDQSLENLMQNKYANIIGVDDHIYQEEIEQPSIDVNEGDSGVGSDMANPSEKEDQNVDDVHVSEHYDNSDKRSIENEDLEESEALETCRETIESLKKLGKQSSITIDEKENRNDEINLIDDKENTAISIISKSSKFRDNCSNDNQNESQNAVTEFNWNQLSVDLSTKDNGNEREIDDDSQNETDPLAENAGSLLQNFLIEHNRRNQSETLSENLPPVETEYVSLEKLAETCSTCRVCNEKFKDIAHLDDHKSKVGHYQCNVPDCVNLLFHSLSEVSLHKSQVHDTQLSPHINNNSPHVNQASVRVNNNSPHTMTIDSANITSTSQLNRNSPLAIPHQSNPSPYGSIANQQMVPPINFDQLPAPVQQLAQQVQRMPLPQSQITPSLPPGANTMIPASNYFIPPPGRPPSYRITCSQNMHYPSQLAHLYSPVSYGPGPYPQMTGPPQMHPQLSQQMQRGRYPVMTQNLRAPRIPQTASAPRQRLKRPVPTSISQQHQQNFQKQRRMDVLMPDKNEDDDCHVIAQQKRNDGLPVIQNVQSATTQPSIRSDSTIHLTDSITLSLRQPAQTQNIASANKTSDAKTVANVLAARGITVTPASNKNRISEQNKQPKPNTSTNPQPPNITAINLNSAISIIPTTPQRKQQSPQQEQNQFAVPQNKQNKSNASEVERPPRPPTVDLTQDKPSPTTIPLQNLRRGRPSRSHLTCQVCDKPMQNQEALTQHMTTHRTSNKLLHKCNLCPAQYPSAQALSTHKHTYHTEVDTVAQNGDMELAIPVVDLKSAHVLSRLSNLGIQNYIPLSQLSAQTGGYFGLPIITLDTARNTSICNLGALGATSILSLGPLKHFANR